MNGQNIPGFYYDPEKKKYFKIQSANASRDLNLKYSAQNLRKKERQDRTQKVATARTQRVRRERVIRRHPNGLTQVCIEREIGAHRRSFYVQTSWPKACISGSAAKPRRIVDRPEHGSIRYFDLDPTTKTIYTVYGTNYMQRIPLPTLVIQAEDDFFYPPFDASSWEGLQVTTSPISSLQYLPATGALAATTHGSGAPPFIYISDPDRDGPYVGQEFTPKACPGIWTASARPAHLTPSPTHTITASSTEALAVAASTSLVLVTRSDTGSWSITTPISDLESDILALEWISYTTIALGCRNGKILLHDTRSGGSSHVLTHPSPVARIKRADDATRLVVSGLGDSMCLYDFRSPRPPKAGKSESKFDSGVHHVDQYVQSVYHPNNYNRKRRKTNYAKWSQPVLTFTHCNSDDLELDIAVHERLGLVAAGQQGEVPIRVSNLWTGETVRELGRGEERNMSLKWVDDDDGGVGLWANGNGGIVRYGW
jgi:hypothetical protein